MNLTVPYCLMLILISACATTPLPTEAVLENSSTITNSTVTQYFADISKTYIYGQPYIKLKITTNKPSENIEKPLQPFKINVGNASYSTTISNGIAEISYKSLSLNPDNLPRQVKASIEFNNNKLEISPLMNQLFENEEKKRQVEIVNDLKHECGLKNISACLKLQINATSSQNDIFFATAKLCSVNYKNSCADARESGKFYDTRDLAYHLDNSTIQLSKGTSLEKNIMLYFGEYLKAVQKVQGGYLITADNRVFNDNPYGYSLAYLSTQEKMSEGTTFCGWFYYTGPYEYVSLSGFTKSIPAFKVFTGNAPTRYGACSEKWFGKN